MTIIDNHTNDWKTVTSSSQATIQGNQSQVQHQQNHPHPQIHISRRPTDRLEEFFYEQAKFFRHLERKYERFNQKSREDERHARAGKFQHRPKPTLEQVQQHQQQAKPVVYGPYTLKQQQASDQRRAQKQASNQRNHQQGQASGSTQKEDVRNSKGDILKGK
jgi:hypothetical protein